MTKLSPAIQAEIDALMSQPCPLSEARARAEYIAKLRGTKIGNVEQAMKVSGHMIFRCGK